MINIHQQVLALLKGCDSKAPMSLGVLAFESGLVPGLLNPIIDQMHLQIPALVGKCEITRNDAKQLVVWPTGVIQSFKGDIKGAIAHVNTWSISKAKPKMPPRRSEKPKVQFKTTETQPKPAMANKTENSMRGKFKAVDIVKQVHLAPGISVAAVIEFFAPSNSIEKKERNLVAQMIDYCVRKKYLEKTAEKTLILGSDEVWLAQNNLLPEANNPSKGGEETAITAELTAQPGQDSKEEFCAKFSKRSDEERIPAFLRKEPEKDFVAPVVIARSSTTFSIEKIFKDLPKSTELSIGRTSDDELYVVLNLLDGDVLLDLDADLEAVDKAITAVHIIQQYRQVN